MVQSRSLRVQKHSFAKDQCAAEILYCTALKCMLFRSALLFNCESFTKQDFSPKKYQSKRTSLTHPHAHITMVYCPLYSYNLPYIIWKNATFLKPWLIMGELLPVNAKPMELQEEPDNLILPDVAFFRSLAYRSYFPTKHEEATKLHWSTFPWPSFLHKWGTYHFMKYILVQ